jgi:NhaP-type Na+/H+ or K+/H+ antiporter
MMDHQPLLTILFMIVGGVACLLLAHRARIPSILFLLCAGIGLGPHFAGLVQPEVFRSNLSTYIALLAALVLFEGGTSLKKDQFRDVSGMVRNLLSTGVLVTWAGVTLAVHGLLGAPWRVAVLFGALMIVTGPTVVGPILQRVRVREQLHNVLKWEAILVDPLGVVTAVVAFELLHLNEVGLVGGLGLFVARLVLGTLLGLAAGAVITVSLRKSRFLRFEGDEFGGLFMLAAVLFFFGVSDVILSETGLVVVTVAGIYVGNSVFPGKEEILRFGRQLTLFSLSILFVLLSSGIPVGDLALWAKPSGWLLVVMIFLIRPLSVLASSWGGGRMPWRETVFISLLAPRGIVSAALASLFAVALVEQKIPGTDFFLPAAFFVIVGTIVFYAVVSPWAARLLGVREAPGKNLVIVGANPLGRLLAAELLKDGMVSVFVDTNPQFCRKARKEGFSASLGSGFDAGRLESLDLKGIGRMVALTSNHEVNVLSCQAFSRFLGKEHTFRLWGGADTWESVHSPAYDATWGRPLLFPPADDQVSIWEELDEKKPSIERLTLETPLSLSPDSLAGNKITWPLYALVEGNVIFPQPDTPIPAGGVLVHLVFSDSTLSGFLGLFKKQ